MLRGAIKTNVTISTHTAGGTGGTDRKKMQFSMFLRKRDMH